MEPFTLLYLTTFIFGFIYYLLKSNKRPENFPPGPSGIPVFGNSLQIGADVHKFAIKMEPVYGTIIGIKNGSYLCVILNNADDIREAYNRSEFAGRFGYNPFMEENISLQTKGVVLSQGATWQELRRFSLKTLREFGFGKRSIEASIQEEVRELIEVKFRPNLGKPMVNHELFNASVLNVIWSLVGGERFKLGDERLDEFIHIVSENFKTSFDGFKILNFLFPIVVTFRNLLPFDLPDSSRAGQRKLLGFLVKTIQEHRDTFQTGNPRDFIDVYLEEKMQNSPKSKEEEDILLAYTLFDFFGAGSDTTSTTISWALFFLASHPDIQEKLFQEIQSLARNRAVCLDDRVSMPYTEAVMLEVHRMASLAPIGVPHATTENVDFKGYRIPKNTMIFANLFACHFSQTTWGDPFNFRPERFLLKETEGQGQITFTRHPNVLPFSTGKRQCLGETTAKDEFFIFLTNIVQQLKIVFPKDEPKHALEGQRGLVLTPITHRIIFLDRHGS